jgi:Tfp pilus assembly protein FimT
MQTLTAGNWSKPRVYCSTFHKGRAYTLVELTVVIFLIGLVLALTVPRIQHGLFSDDLKAASRRMIGTVRTLRDNAVRDQKAYMLHFDMALNRFWVSWDAMTAEERAEARQNASALPGGIRVVDVYYKGTGKKDVGDAAIRFTKQGYVQQAVIHLGANDGRTYSLVLSPFLGTVKTYDRYVEI